MNFSYASLPWPWLETMQYHQHNQIMHYCINTSGWHLSKCSKAIIRSQSFTHLSVKISHILAKIQKTVQPLSFFGIRCSFKKKTNVTYWTLAVVKNSRSIASAVSNSWINSSSVSQSSAVIGRAYTRCQQMRPIMSEAETTKTQLIFELQPNWYGICLLPALQMKWHYNYWMNSHELF